MTFRGLKNWSEKQLWDALLGSSMDEGKYSEISRDDLRNEINRRVDERQKLVENNGPIASQNDSDPYDEFNKFSQGLLTDYDPTIPPNSSMDLMKGTMYIISKYNAEFLEIRDNPNIEFSEKQSQYLEHQRRISDEIKEFQERYGGQEKIFVNLGKKIEYRVYNEIKAKDPFYTIFNPIEDLVCQHCGTIVPLRIRNTSIGIKHPFRKYCSLECQQTAKREQSRERMRRYRARKGESKERRCVECGKVLTGRSDQITCSAMCRKRLSRKKERTNPLG